ARGACAARPCATSTTPWPTKAARTSGTGRRASPTCQTVSPFRAASTWASALCDDEQSFARWRHVGGLVWSLAQYSADLVEVDDRVIDLEERLLLRRGYVEHGGPGTL